jgi:hypothetical protein
MNENHDNADQRGPIALDNLPFINVWPEDFETETELVHVDCFDLEEAKRIQGERHGSNSNQTKL